MKREKYTMSNSSDLFQLMTHNCDSCRKEKRCKHLLQAMVYDNQDNGVWFYNENGNPKCDDYVRIGTPYKTKRKNKIIDNLKLDL